MEDLEIKMNEALCLVREVIDKVDVLELNNEQFYLDWLDQLNEISVRD